MESRRGSDAIIRAEEPSTRLSTDDALPSLAAALNKPTTQSEYHAAASEATNSNSDPSASNTTWLQQVTNRGLFDPFRRVLALAKSNQTTDESIAYRTFRGNNGAIRVELALPLDGRAVENCRNGCRKNTAEAAAGRASDAGDLQAGNVHTAISSVKPPSGTDVPSAASR